MLKLNDKDPLNTPVQTWDGRKARIICVDRKYPGKETLLALVQDDNGYETCIHYFSNGGFFKQSTSTDDLVNIPQKITRYVNIYKRDMEHFPGGFLYDTPEAAKEAVIISKTYITTAKVEFEV